MALGDYELLTELQSKILGILFGDGSLSKNRGSIQITIAGHKFEDREYLIGHVRPMFELLFAKTLKVLLVNDQNTMVLYGCSKRVALTLHEWGMPLGRKKLSSLTPATPLEEVSFIRGLFDTDGCVYRKYGPYKQIQFKSANRDLLTYVKECLVRLGFHPTSIRTYDTKFRFFLSRQAEIDQFFHVVEPRNTKHLRRFQDAGRKQFFRSYKHRSEALAKSGTDQTLKEQFCHNTLGGATREPSEYSSTGP